MEYPFSTSTGFEVNTTGLGLAARIAAPAANVQPNEAGTAVVQTAMAVEEAPSPRLVIRGGKFLDGGYGSIWGEIRRSSCRETPKADRTSPTAGNWRRIGSPC